MANVTLIDLEIDETDLSDARDAIARYFSRPADDSGTLAEYVSGKLLAEIQRIINRGQRLLEEDDLTYTAITISEAA